MLNVLAEFVDVFRVRWATTQARLSGERGEGVVADSTGLIGFDHSQAVMAQLVARLVNDTVSDQSCHVLILPSYPT